MEGQVIHQGVVKVSTLIQQLQTHQVHLEKTVQDTPETVAEVEPVVAEPMEALEVTVRLEMQVVSEAHQDLTQCQQEDPKTMDRGRIQEAQAVPITKPE